MTTNRIFPLLGAVMIVAFGATLLLSGGWQSAAAAVAIFAGVAFVPAYIALLIAGERPPERARWREAAPRPASAPAPAPEPAAPPERRAPVLPRPAGMPH
jgi:hypothetical protein